MNEQRGKWGMRMREDEVVSLRRKLHYIPDLGTGGTVWGREAADGGAARRKWGVGPPQTIE